jgi:hypothetical protein
MSYQEKYLKYKSKYLNLRAEIHNNNLENRLEQNGGNLDILNIDQLSGTVSITEKKYLMLGGSKENDLNLPDKLTETPVSESENNSSSEEKPKEKSVEKSKEKPDKLDVDSVDSSSEHEDDHKDNNDSSSEEHKDDESHESESQSSESLSPSSSEEIKQKGGKKDEKKKNNKTSWFSDSELVSTDTTFMSFSTLDTSSESDL